MATLAHLRREELAGLGLAIAAHVALVGWLALNPPAPKALPVPERMTVTFSDDAALKSTSPNPAAEAAPAVAPVVAENPVPEPAPDPVPQPRPEPRPQVRPQPVPKPVARVVPAPPPPRPVPQPAARPLPMAKPAPAKPAPASQKPVAKPATKPATGGGSRIGADFLKGLPGGQTPGARANTPPAQEIGPAVRSALAGAIARQLKPKWVAPQGADADQLITVLTFDLNPDGTLAGSPRVVSQQGITEVNRTQAQRHAEQAVRAVRLAAPFDLPSDLYPAWKHVAQFRFDRKLSQ